jgi:Ca-activated chloride channel family protein
MSFTYPDSARYGAPYSPTHSVENVTTARGKRTVTLSGSGSEMTLLLPVRNTRSASISVLSHAAVGESGFALITLTPPVLPPRTTARDVVFVLDVSGSMAGSKMEQAREAGKQLLATLRNGDRFRIVTFSTGVSSFDDNFVASTRENVVRAGAYLDSLEASGSTNFGAAIDEALRSFRSTGNERLPLVLFVTDGAPTVGEQRPEVLAQRAADLRGRARVFTFGVGNDVKAELIETLALEGRGTAQIVNLNESVERAVSVVASRLTSPIVTDLRLQSAGVRLERMHPSDVTDLFAGQDVVVLARYNGSGTATLNFSGTSADGPVRWTSTVNLPAREMGNSFVSRLWATQRVGFLSAERRKNGANPELDEEIRTLGERYSIPTMFTSYMVVEPGIQIGPDGRVLNAVDFARDAANRALQGGSGARGGGGGGRGGAAGQAQAAQGVQAAQGGVAQGQAQDRMQMAQKRVEPGQLTVLPAGSPLAVLAGKVSAFSVGDSATRSLTSHESVKLGESQRQTRSEADINAALAGSGSRRVGDRVFSRTDSTWVDIRANSSLAVVKIKPYSEVYFQLLKAVPALSPVFSLGERVVVAGKSVVIQLDAAGAEKLTASELEALVKKW